jgi:hypothetical protein
VSVTSTAAVGLTAVGGVLATTAAAAAAAAAGLVHLAGAAEASAVPEDRVCSDVRSYSLGDVGLMILVPVPVAAAVGLLPVLPSASSALACASSHSLLHSATSACVHIITAIAAELMLVCASLQHY